MYMQFMSTEMVECSKERREYVDQINDETVWG